MNNLKDKSNLPMPFNPQIQDIQNEAANRAIRRRRQNNMAKYNIDINQPASDDIKKQSTEGY
jgi:hypothetical protein